MSRVAPPTPDRRLACLVVLGTWIAVQAATPDTFLRSSDGKAMFATAESLALRGTLAIPPRYLDDGIPINPAARAGPDGRAYAKYGVGWPAVLAVPLAVANAAGLAPTSAAVQAALLVVNPALTAAAAGVAFAIARRLGAGRRTAAGLAAGGVLTTFAWPTGVSDGADPLMALLVTVTLWSLIVYEETREPRYALAAGASLGAAILVKSALVVLAPGLAVGIAVSASREARRAPAPRRLAAWLRPCAACAAGLAAGLALQLWLNDLRWGSPFASGYNEPVLTGDLRVGLWHLTLGVNKGLAWYAPLAALGLVATLWQWRRRPAWAIGAGLGALALLLVTARFYDFGGGWTWGPRYLLPIVPALAAAAAPVAATRGGRALVGAALALGLAVTAPGVAIDGTAARATFATAWLPEVAGTIRSGDTHRPGLLVEQPRPVEDAVPEFSGPAVHGWLIAVIAEPCACDRLVWWCACRDGGDLYWNERFRRPPWAAKYPGIEARPPYGEDLIAPALAGRLYRAFVFDVTATGPPAPHRGIDP